MLTFLLIIYFPKKNLRVRKVVVFYFAKKKIDSVQTRVNSDLNSGDNHLILAFYIYFSFDALSVTVTTAMMLACFYKSSKRCMKG
jgi:hypothetical protein